jgi:hypothetical protein
MKRGSIVALLALLLLLVSAIGALAASRRVYSHTAHVYAGKASAGTIRDTYGSPAYTDSNLVDHPAYYCDHTYTWAATRRG